MPFSPQQQHQVHTPESAPRNLRGTCTRPPLIIRTLSRTHAGAINLILACCWSRERENEWEMKNVTLSKQERSKAEESLSPAKVQNLRWCSTRRRAQDPQDDLILPQFWREKLTLREKVYKSSPATTPIHVKITSFGYDFCASTLQQLPNCRRTISAKTRLNRNWHYNSNLGVSANYIIYNTFWSS